MVDTRLPGYLFILEHSSQSQYLWILYITTTLLHDFDYEQCRHLFMTRDSRFYLFAANSGLPIPHAMRLTILDSSGKQRKWDAMCVHTYTIRNMQSVTCHRLSYCSSSMHMLYKCVTGEVRQWRVLQCARRYCAEIRDFSSPSYGSAVGRATVREPLCCCFKPIIEDRLFFD